MISPAELVREALIDAGLATEAGSWPCYFSRMPDSDPVDVIATFDTGGRDPLLMEEGLRRPTVQIRLRSAQYSDGWSKANAIYETLGTTYNHQYSADRVVGFAVRGDVLYVGRTSEDACLFSVNLELMRDTSQ